MGPKEMAVILRIKPVTVRKYSDILEKAGYIVQRGENGRRKYSENDAILFRELQGLCERSGMTLESASKVVVSRSLENSDSVAPTIITLENELLELYDERYKEVNRIVESMIDHNHYQAELLEKQT